MRSSKPKTAAAVIIAVTIATCALLTGVGLLGLTTRRQVQLPSGPPSATLLPTGQLLTPSAAPGSTFVPLNPGLRDYPDFRADGAVSLAMSPDRRSMLVLTSGYNTNGDFETPDPAGSNQYVFVFDVTGVQPVQRQVIRIPNTYSGIAFSPDGTHFYVSGGVDDNVYVYARTADGWSASNRPPIALNHHGLANGVLQIDGAPAVQKSAALKPYVQGPLAAGLAGTADGRRLVVANHYNDSVSVIDLSAGVVSAELDLRPGRSGGASGTPGGEYPYWVEIVGNETAYVSSVRDREIVVVDLSGARPSVKTRIAVPGAPNKMVLDRAQTLLYVANDLQDVVSVIDVRRNALLTSFSTVAPEQVLGPSGYHGASPDALALSPDGHTLYVTNRGTNSLAVIDLPADFASGSGRQPKAVAIAGLIPTGWSPQDVGVARDGRTLYIINARSPAGANPGNCFGLVAPCRAAAARPKSFVPNTYVLNLEKAGLLTVPLPSRQSLAALTQQVAKNNGWDLLLAEADSRLMAALRARIRHVIYIIKENRTYDQVLGDLGVGNGDAALAEFPRAITPNQHRLAESFVALDNFEVPGEVSGNGWPWSMAARETDIGSKNVAMSYSNIGRGGSYDWQGVNRFINSGLTGAARHAANPATPPDPDLLPGNRNVAAPDGPEPGEIEQGYLWNAALRAHLSVRNYGLDVDQTLYDRDWGSLAIPMERRPAQHQVPMASAAHPELVELTDPYFRSFDTSYPDFYREAEWEREFNGYVKSGDLPALSMVCLMMDHTSGGAPGALDGVDTPETQVADNDYALGRLVEAVARSRYARDTLIFVVEDDAQDGPDHVDAHRSIAFVAGAYVKHGAVVSARYTTINMIRTMTDLLGLDHLGIFDAHVRPMTEVFDLHQEQWSFRAQVPNVLRSTRLPLPPGPDASAPVEHPSHPASWWAQRTRGMDLTRRDSADAQAYNRILWEGLMGARPYPAVRTGQAGRDADD